MCVYARAFPQISYAAWKRANAPQYQCILLIAGKKKLRDIFPTRFSSVLMTFTGSHRVDDIAAQENNDII